MKRILFTVIISIVSTVSFAQDNGYYPQLGYSNGMWGYKVGNEFVIEPIFKDASTFREGFAAVKLYGKYGFIDKSGSCVVPFRFESARSFQEGLASVKTGGKWGFIDKSGKTVIHACYDSTSDFTDGIATLKLNGKTYYATTDGKVYDSMDSVPLPYSRFAKKYVVSFVNDWQKKGKYEKTADWQKRVNETTRQAVVDSLLKIAQREYIAEQSKKIVKEQRIVEYDADGEIFLINVKTFGDILVPVPISQAPEFEKNFSSATRTDTYYIANDRIGLESAVFKMPNGRKYRYKNDAELEFASIDINYNFDKLDINIEETDTRPSSKPQINHKSVSVGKSDVDLSIPVTGAKNANTFAVIIANEKYQTVSEVNYAENDGKSFKEYCTKTLGIPEKNIHYNPNATLANMWTQVDWLTNIAKTYNGNANIIFYYAGHGIPDEQSRDAYLLPIDGNGSNIKTGYKLSELYSSLSKYRTKQTLVFLDACFSGAERSGGMLASARGVALKAKKEVPQGNLVVFSAAQGDETAYQYSDKGHGMFTYFLLKKLKESNGNTSLGELADYLSEQVSRLSIIENSKIQTPAVIASDELSEKWKQLKMK